eukprot:TRINITY_DN25992_c0_g1_i1.p1 TRINITY_DN25992_c0_g1~~TRINITY_DN25992_c0_g1_i1.p1  ORF type:complete len:179 (+),score=43.49 TRINITY_DN25992_c0_g1_i1:68-538(+)
MPAATVLAPLWYAVSAVNLAARLVGDFIGLVYPVWATLCVVYPVQARAGLSRGSLLDSSRQHSGANASFSRHRSQRYRQWCSYWVCLGVLWLLENAFSFLVQYVPLYFYVRIAVLVLLSAGRGGEWLLSLAVRRSAALRKFVGMSCEPARHRMQRT